MATKIKGLGKLNRKMKAIPVRARKAAAKIVVDAAYDIAEMQYGMAPVDDGDLRNSIEVTGPGGTTPAYSHPGGARKANPEEAIITAGNTKVRYAHLVEFGTAPHAQGGKFAGTQHPGTAEQAFFWPAYRALRTSTKSRISRAVKKAIVDVAKS